MGKGGQGNESQETGQPGLKSQRRYRCSPKRGPKMLSLLIVIAIVVVTLCTIFDYYTLSLTLRRDSHTTTSAGTSPAEPVAGVETHGPQPEWSSAHERLDSLVDRLAGLLPHSFSPRYTNPCWVAGKTNGRTSRTLSCFPAFFLLGFPKCGTTELYRILQLHPRFASPLKKELQWWANSNPAILSHVEQEFQNYLHYFDPAAKRIKQDPRMITGDCSPSTAWRTIFKTSPDDFPPYSLPYVFSKLFPHLKFIVIMRNPVEQLYSWFWYSCHLKRVRWPANLIRKGPEIFELLAHQTIAEFRKCCSHFPNTTDSVYKCREREFRAQYEVSLSKESLEVVKDRECGLIHLKDSLYFFSLKKWLQYFPREKFLFLRTEDLATDSVSVAQSIYRFLGMGELEESKLKRGLAKEEHANAQSFIHTGNLSMKTSTRQFLTDFYTPYNNLLAQLLQDERLLWT